MNERKIYHIENGSVLTESDLDSLIFSNDNRLVPQVSLSVDPLFTENFNAGRAMFRPPEYQLLSDYNPKTQPYCVNGTVANLTCFSCASDSYGHWMTDVLPRLALYKNSGTLYDFLYLPYQGFIWQDEILSLADVSKSQIIPYPEQKFLKCDKVISTPFPRPSWDVPEWIPQALQSILSRKVNSDQSSKMVYGTRKDAKWRRVLNEDALEKLLVDRYGIQIVTMSSLTVAQKIELFGNINLVISIHGSTLSNTFFSRPYTKVLEIFGPGQISPLHKQIAEVNHLEYHSLQFGDSDTNERGCIESAFLDFSVDLDIIKHKLDMLLQT